MGCHVDRGAGTADGAARARLPDLCVGQWSDTSASPADRLRTAADEARVCRVPPEGADPQATPLEDVARDGKEMGEIMLRGNMVMKE
jgi:hypothetical protein